MARKIDGAQQGFAPAAFVFGVIKKFGDDRAGSLAALIAYYGFLSLFPLLLLLATILGIVAGHNPSFAKSVEHSALSQFPVIGTQLGKNITALHKNSVPGLVVGILGLVWGSQGAIQAAQYAMAEVWNVPGVVRPNFWSRLVRTLLMMALMGVFLLLSTFLTGFISFSAHEALVTQIGAVLLSLALNVLLYLVAFRVLTPKQVGHVGLLLGATLGGIGWTALQLGGTILVDHTLRNASHLYGFFAVVLGLIAWIYLAAEMTLYVAEVNVVRARRLWPRSLVQPPLTPADQEVLEYIAKQDERRPEQHVSVRFHPATSPPADAANQAPVVEGTPGAGAITPAPGTAEVSDEEPAGDRPGPPG
ncbi:MAG TPA: YihY/virulence factor BrkB family protein [Acidimicrobiales bacterium]|nr:YihY/virulence factor BrkB family protein [Acidimicrobiales bacterium]